MRPRDQRLIGYARGMRHDPTAAEQALWRILRGRRFRGLKFRRQVPIGPFIADFVCVETQVIVECDGGQHGGIADLDRDAWLEARGLRLVRLWNSELLDDGDDAALAMLEAKLGRT